ncbi:family 10 glycosylhydrolase [Candidatus Uabimicrobium amorphum]|uniref:Cell surface protein n=1 Tax=Uabimicrobium amorphum TaxID=2596890 RepID=A0A5S9IRJ8_UABAM|nr:family 10 glycosylhydrolase [Candidatus Uabimicrobium amorphum]BBM86813.1 cell surface protein [Candidatus Uabimicrobium amorphum]
MIKILSILLICLLCLPMLVSENEELRGLWVTRFEWPDKDPQKCRENIKRCFADMAKANFNAVFFQIRGEADVLYPSKLEPWSELIGGKDPGFDPLKLAIAEARKYGIQFHAYINPVPMVLWVDQKPPQNKNHIFYKHGPHSDDSWVCIDEDGKVMDAKAAAYYYFSMGNPKVQEYLRTVIRDLVTRYDIDGLHLDRIRYPGPQYSHDKPTVQRFRSHGNPNHHSWQDWQREQLNKFINDVYAEVSAVNPKIVLSCASWGIYSRYHVPGYETFSSGYHDYFQDSWSWIHGGMMDILVPMIYWDMKDPKPNYQELAKDFARGVGAKRFAGGQRMYGDNWPAIENVAQVIESRRQKLSGTVIFSYESATQKKAFALLRDKVYQEKATLPDLKNPTHKNAIILGKVLNSEGKPMVDTWVTLHDASGKKLKTWTSGQDGRYAFVNVPVGKVDVVVTYHNDKTQKIQVSVKSGEVRNLDFTLNTAKVDVPAIDVWQIHNNNDHCHILARTSPANAITVNGKRAEVNINGMFAYDNIALRQGKNEIVIEAVSPTGEKSQRIITLEASRATATAKATTKIVRRQTWQKSRLAQTNEDKVGITHGTHYVRLGGPYIAEVEKGTMLEIIGEEGNFYEVKLAHSLNGWVKQSQVTLMENSNAVPQGYFTYCNAYGESNYDVVRVPMGAKVVYSLESETSPQNAILVNFYATHHATTWFSHRNTAQVIGEMSGKQIQEGWYQLRIPVKSAKIWGFWHQRDASGISIYIKHPPKIDRENPFNGLTIALEAGHGGSNTGAIGVSKAKEKDVNRKAVDVLQQQLEERGAKVVLLRYRDTYPSHKERLDKAIMEKADLLVSMHANATGTKKGFLRISGVCTFYKGAHNYTLAKAVYDELLGLGWDEFGVVGNFNYYPLRSTHMPAVLVEQGFMTNPYDEAQLLDKSFQVRQAAAIIRGLSNFLTK